MKKLGNVEKWSFGEMTSNSNGKTSATSTAGVYVVFIGGICFLLGCIEKAFLSDSVDIIMQSIIFTSTGVGLLGWGKHKATDLDIADVGNESKGENEHITKSDEQLNS